MLTPDLLTISRIARLPLPLGTAHPMGNFLSDIDIAPDGSIAVVNLDGEVAWWGPEHGAPRRLKPLPGAEWTSVHCVQFTAGPNHRLVQAMGGGDPMRLHSASGFVDFVDTYGALRLNTTADGVCAVGTQGVGVLDEKTGDFEPFNWPDEERLFVASAAAGDAMVLVSEPEDRSQPTQLVYFAEAWGRERWRHDTTKSVAHNLALNTENLVLASKGALTAYSLDGRRIGTGACGRYESDFVLTRDNQLLSITDAGVCVRRLPDLVLTGALPIDDEPLAMALSSDERLLAVATRSDVQVFGHPDR